MLLGGEACFALLVCLGSAACAGQHSLDNQSSPRARQHLHDYTGLGFVAVVSCSQASQEAMRVEQLACLGLINAPSFSSKAQDKHRHHFSTTTATAIVPGCLSSCFYLSPTHAVLSSLIPPSLPSPLPHSAPSYHLHVERREQQDGAQEAYGRHRSGTYTQFHLSPSFPSLSPPLIERSTHLFPSLPLSPFPQAKGGDDDLDALLTQFKVRCLSSSSFCLSSSCSLPFFILWKTQINVTLVSIDECVCVCVLCRKTSPPLPFSPIASFFSAFLSLLLLLSHAFSSL